MRGISFIRRQIRSVRKRYVQARHGSRPFVCRYLKADFNVGLENGVEREIAYRSYERDRIVHFLALCKAMRPDLLLDIGANIGVYSCIVMKNDAARRTIAFEPDPRNFAALQANIDLNGIGGNCKAVRIGAGALPGRAHLVPGPAENWGASRICNDGAVEIDIRPIDSIVFDGGGVIAVKIDVEGFEVEALTGAQRTLRRNRSIVQVETYQSREVVFAMMQEFGFVLERDFNPDFVFVKGSI